MKKQVLCVAVCALLLLTAGCAQTQPKDERDSVISSGASSESSVAEPSDESGDSRSSKATAAENSSSISYQVSRADKPAAEKASAESPLSIGQWGSAAKYSTKDGAYVQVPVRIVSVRRGNSVNKEVTNTAKKTGVYLFSLKDNEEYALADYEICLDDFPVGEGGTLADITAFITGPDGQAIKTKEGGYWGTTAVCLDQTAYFYEGVIRSQMAFPILKNCSDYLINLGEYGEAQTFVRGES